MNNGLERKSLVVEVISFFLQKHKEADSLTDHRGSLFLGKVWRKLYLSSSYTEVTDVKQVHRQTFTLLGWPFIIEVYNNLYQSKLDNCTDKKFEDRTKP